MGFWTRLFKRGKKPIALLPPATPAEAEAPVAPITPIGPAVLIVERPAAVELPPVTEPAPEPAPLPPVVPALVEELLDVHASTALQTYTKPQQNDYFTPGAYAPADAGMRMLLAPDLSFRLTRVSTPVVAPRLVEAPAAPAAALPAPAVVTFDPAGLTACIIEREGSPNVPPALANEYLIRPEWMVWGVALRDQIVENWMKGNEPLDAHDLYLRAFNATADSCIALLLCFEVTRSFARGGEAIRWEVLDRARGQYTDGVHLYTAAVKHRMGVLRPSPLQSPSIFYLLFAAAEFAMSDPGDWYRFFAAAAVACLTARGRTAPKDATSTHALAAAIINFALADQPDPGSAQFGWTWANAISLSETAASSCSERRSKEISDAYRRGAAFGLEQAGSSSPASWTWKTAQSGSGQMPISSEPHLSVDTLAQVLETGSPHIRMTADKALFQILCTVEEGIQCRFSSAPWTDPVLKPVAVRMADELGWKNVEHAVRRQVAVRCTVAKGDIPNAVCEWDRGRGFERISHPVLCDWPKTSTEPVCLVVSSNWV